jgi:hypothetical protein
MSPTSGRTSPTHASGRVSPSSRNIQVNPFNNIKASGSILKDSLYKLSSPDSHSQISALIEKQRQESIRELERLKQNLAGKYSSPDRAVSRVEEVSVPDHPHHLGTGVSAHIKAIENINKATRYYNHRHLRPYFLRFVQYFLDNYRRSRKWRTISRYQRKRVLLLHFNKWRSKREATIKYNNLYKFRGNSSLSSRLLTHSLTYSLTHLYKANLAITSTEFTWDSSVG